MAIEKPCIAAGLFYIYLSNESNTLNEVYFDDFEITLNESKVIQSNDYYPFELQHNASWTRMDQDVQCRYMGQNYTPCQ